MMVKKRKRIRQGGSGYHSSRISLNGQKNLNINGLKLVDRSLQGNDDTNHLIKRTSQKWTFM